MGLQIYPVKLGVEGLLFGRGPYLSSGRCFGVWAEGLYWTYKERKAFSGAAHFLNPP